MHPIFSEFPAIESSNFKLRRLRESDVEDFYHYIIDDNVKKYLSDADIPSSLENAKSELMYWAHLYTLYKSIYWGIATLEDDKLIGTCGFNHWNRMHRRAEISYDLAFSHWGRGIMTQAIKSITEFALSKMDVQRVQATVAVDNISSIRVLEKCGYQKDGILQKYGILHGESKDFYMYSLTR